MGRDYAAMDNVMLNKELLRLKDELEDMEDTFNFNLANTSAHINAGMVSDHQLEMDELRQEIATIEKLL